MIINNLLIEFIEVIFLTKEKERERKKEVENELIPLHQYQPTVIILVEIEGR